MLIPFSPRNVPTRPTTPGTSKFSSISIPPVSSASIGNRLILTMRGVVPNTVPETEVSPASVTATTRTRLA